MLLCICPIEMSHLKYVLLHEVFWAQVYVANLIVELKKLSYASVTYKVN